MNNLSYFDDVLSMVKHGRYHPGDEAAFIKQMQDHADSIAATVRAQLITDPGSLKASMLSHKTACCNLLLRSLQLQAELQTDPPGKGKLQHLMRNIRLTALIDVLETLYGFYVKTEKRMRAKEEY
ncbi:hypothetical protein ABIE26_003231 [Pedobacter africanus]|uniref:Uncharacterized protein n=1 Tax=Pedobacter africanus TaxID=151894 RepID=A0ACC6KYX9_9SPHI|nr:hypothetical protein [Pedobacter africanus]MDR6784585.1 hypothetical protein [Pedobacter africanus]